MASSGNLVDKGAITSNRERLIAEGVTGIEGRFQQGDAVGNYRAAAWSVAAYQPIRPKMLPALPGEKP